ncbi:MAG: hypothetical protein IIT57_11640 [Treponema sp.]|nr:hypothetical protein [Treponema sp.]
MKIYDQYVDLPTKWFCQGKGDIIFFALINSEKLSPRFFPWLKPNEDMEEKSPEEKILFELKVLTVWAFITGCFPFKHKETFYTIYTAFMHLTENKAKLEESLYRKKFCSTRKK